MITLYAAIGTASTGMSAGSKAMVERKGLDFAVNLSEFILWSSAIWTILHYDELKKSYAAKAAVAGLPAMKFDMVLEQLLERKLMLSGTGETGVDALYNLLEHAFISPFEISLWERITSFFQLTIGKQVPLRITRNLFREPKRIGLQRDVWHLIKQRSLSTAELIRCIELGIRDVSKSSRLVETIYSEQNEVNYKNIGIHSRLSDQQMPVLEAVAQLYLNKQVILDICE